MSTLAFHRSHVERQHREPNVGRLRVTSVVLKSEGRGVRGKAAVNAEKLIRSRHAVRALDWIFAKPIFSTTEFVDASGIPAATARRFLAMLRTGGILVDLRPGHGQKPAILAFPELLNLTEGRTVL